MKSLSLKRILSIKNNMVISIYKKAILEILKPLLLFAIVLFFQSLHAQDHLLDHTFGKDGKSLTTGGQGYNAPIFIQSLSNNKILIAASVQYGKKQKLTFIRFNSNGGVDSSFADKGSLLINLQSGSHKIQLDNDDNIYIVGMRDYYDTLFTLAKYNSEGRVDSSFGIKGSVVLKRSDKDREVFIWILNSTLYLGGNLYSKSYSLSEIQKFDLNGIRNDSFGINGLLNFENKFSFSDLNLTEDGKIILLGGWKDNIILRKYHANGLIDSSFGISGELTYDDSLRYVPNQIEIQDNHDVLVSGLISQAGSYMFLARFHNDGTLDTTFANRGFLKVTSPNAYPNELKFFTKDQNIITVHSESINGFDSINIKRFFEDGSPDTTFAASLYFNTLRKYGDVSMDANGGLKFLNQVVNFTTLEYFKITDLGPDASLNSLFANDGNLDLYLGFGLTQNSELLSLNNNTFIQGNTEYYNWGTNIQLINYNADGIQNQTWSNHGNFVPPRQRVYMFNFCGTVQPDGKLLIGGATSIDSVTDQPYHLYLCRILANGILDSSYANNGFNYVTNQSFGESYVMTIAIESDHNILIGGRNEYRGYSLLRLDPDGNIKTVFEKMKISPIIFTNKILVTKDHKIYNAGLGYNSLTHQYYSQLARYLIDGTLDFSFGDSATSKISTATNDLISTAAIDPYERIILAGFDSIPGGDSSLFACRVLSSGIIDSTFGINGYFRYKVNNSNSACTSVLIDKAGRIYLGGVAYKTGTRDFILLCLDQDGHLLNTFGDNGEVYVDFDGGDDYVNSMLFDNDENIILSGNTVTTEASRVGLCKVLNNLNVGTLDENASASLTYLYPNPIINNANLKFAMKNAGTVSIDVTDLNGKLIQSILQQNYFPSGINEIQIHIPKELVDGYYVLRLISENNVKNVLFIHHSK